jgi:hypothetical protein
MKVSKVAVSPRLVNKAVKFGCLGERGSGRCTPGAESGKTVRGPFPGTAYI